MSAFRVCFVVGDVFKTHSNSGKERYLQVTTMDQ